MISVVEAQGARPKGLPLFTIKNANHDKVMTAVDKLIRERNSRACSCGRCISDIVALTLNYLPPHYYVDVDQRIELGSPWVMIENAVGEAIERVMENPRHKSVASCSRVLYRP